MRPQDWQPIVQNHFIAAARPPVPLGSDELLVSRVPVWIINSNQKNGLHL
jgi:hypothetical protein